MFLWPFLSLAVAFLKRDLQDLVVRFPWISQRERETYGGLGGEDGLEALPVAPPVPVPSAFLCGGGGSGGGCLMRIGGGLFCIVYLYKTFLLCLSLPLIRVRIWYFWFFLLYWSESNTSNWWLFNYTTSASCSYISELRGKKWMKMNYFFFGEISLWDEQRGFGI
jgi:hypothetical protein